MPYIRISDPTGVPYHITSSDNETLARWLVETLSLVTSPNPAYAQIRIEVRPLWVGSQAEGAWDWHPGANREFWSVLRGVTPIGNIRQLALALDAYAAKLEGEERG